MQAGIYKNNSSGYPIAPNAAATLFWSQRRRRRRLYAMTAACETSSLIVMCLHYTV